MKFKIVGGFRSSADVFLAMERGEVDGICESLDSIRNRRPDWISNKTVNVLLQGGAAPNPELKGVPMVLDFARTEEERQIIQFLYAGQAIGRPFVAPPGLPPERLKLLRDAFAATMADPDFAAEAKKYGYDLDPEDGDHLAGVIERISCNAEGHRRARRYVGAVADIATYPASGARIGMTPSRAQGWGRLHRLRPGAGRKAATGARVSRTFVGLSSALHLRARLAIRTTQRTTGERARKARPGVASRVLRTHKSAYFPES